MNKGIKASEPNRGIKAHIKLSQLKDRSASINNEEMKISKQNLDYMNRLHTLVPQRNESTQFNNSSHLGAPEKGSGSMVNSYSVRSAVSSNKPPSPRKI